MKNEETESALPHIIVELLEYVPNAIMTRTILKKSTGNVTVSSVSTGEELAERSIAFDTYVQIIDGTADVTIRDQKHTLHLGQGIIIPGNTSHFFKANEQFKMISTIIKSGYEDLG